MKLYGDIEIVARDQVPAGTLAIFLPGAVGIQEDTSPDGHVEHKLRMRPERVAVIENIGTKEEA